MRLGPRHGMLTLPRIAHASCVLIGIAALLLVVTPLTGLPWTVSLGILAGSLIVPAGFELLSPALSRWRSREGLARIAIIGDAGAAERLSEDLIRDQRRFEFLGRIATPGEVPSTFPAVAELGGLRRALIDHDIQLLILSPTVSRELVFDELVGSCLDLPVQLVELSYFYETVFGYVPISEMNAVWFQYLLDPSSRFPHPLAKRAIDLCGTLLLGLPALPLSLIIMLLVRRDGGPAIFRQTRIGEGGRPFTLYKFRTMRLSSATSAQWAAVDDPRVTRIGRFLRRTHLDELPQLLNVLRGEMSLVGPRPEQPAFVERLEREVPFYQRRHLIRPGMSGWAQISCGYARSDRGSVWKHCHDLFYLKHRSIGLDLWILAMTARLVLLGCIRLTEPATHPALSDTVVSHTPSAVAENSALMASGNGPSAVAENAALMTSGSAPSAVAENAALMASGNPPS